MRHWLKEREGQKVRAQGTFVRYGVKDGDGCRWTTAVLENITCGGEKVADHLWFTLRGSWLHTELTEGALVEVTGTVYKYHRRYGSVDYGLDEVTNVVVLKKSKSTVKPCRIWKYSKFVYFKFLTDNGPRWYRQNIYTKNLEKIQFVKNDGGFDEIVVNQCDDDLKYIKAMQSSTLKFN